MYRMVFYDFLLYIDILFDTINNQEINIGNIALCEIALNLYLHLYYKR